MTARLQTTRAALAYAALIRFDVERVSKPLFWLLVGWSRPKMEADRTKRRARREAFRYRTRRTTLSMYARLGRCAND